MRITEEKHIPCMLMHCDFEKAFDSVSHKSIQLILSFFNFGSKLCSWINTLYDFANILLCIKVFLHTTRLSAKRTYISLPFFILCAEILSFKICAKKKHKKNNNNRWHWIKNVTVRWWYITFIRWVRKLLKWNFKWIRKIQTLSDLKLNTEKTK